MPLQIYPTFSSPGNGQNCYPMLYYAPQNPYQHQQHPHYDPATTSFLAMPSLIPEQQPLYYTIDQHGNYVLLTPPQTSAAAAHLQLSDLSNNSSGGDIGGELPHLLLSSSQLDSIDSSLSSSLPNDPSSSFYDSRIVNRCSLLNASLLSRKSGGSGGKSRNSSAYKTMMCNMFSTNGTCSYGAGCQYAHGKEEIRPTVPHPKYKTQLCNKFNSPRGCQYGEKCHFRHPDDHEKHNEETKKLAEDESKETIEDGSKKSVQDEHAKKPVEDESKNIVEDGCKKSTEDESKKPAQDDEAKKTVDDRFKKSIHDEAKKSGQDESLLK